MIGDMHKRRAQNSRNLALKRREKQSRRAAATQAAVRRVRGEKIHRRCVHVRQSGLILSDKRFALLQQKAHRGARSGAGKGTGHGDVNGRLVAAVRLFFSVAFRALM